MSWAFSGESGVQNIALEAERRKTDYSIPFRFYLKKGTEAEVIILDKKAPMYFFYEHSIPGPGGSWVGSYTELSPKSCGEPDPLETHAVINGSVSTPYYCLYISILDLMPYTTKSGEVRPYSRKLLVIRGEKQMNAFNTLFNNSMEEYGETRGLHFKLERSTDNFSPRIGEIKPLGLSYGKLSDAELVSRYGHEAVKSKEGKVILEKNEMTQAVNYHEKLERPTTEGIAKKYGILLGSAVLKGDTPISKIVTPDEAETIPADSQNIEDIPF